MAALRHGITVAETPIRPEAGRAAGLRGQSDKTEDWSGREEHNIVFYQPHENQQLPVIY